MPRFRLDKASTDPVVYELQEFKLGGWGNQHQFYESELAHLLDALHDAAPDAVNAHIRKRQAEIDHENGGAPEAQDIRRKSPEERAERRARIAGAIGTLIEHAPEVIGILGLFGVKVPTLPPSLMPGE